MTITADVAEYLRVFCHVGFFHLPLIDGDGIDGVIVPTTFFGFTVFVSSGRFVAKPVGGISCNAMAMGKIGKEGRGERLLVG